MQIGGEKLKPEKISWALIFIGILFLLIGIILGRLVYNKGLEVNGVFSMKKIVVSVKTQLDTQGTNGFSEDNIKGLVKQLNTNNLTYTGQSGLISSFVRSDNSSSQAKITGTNYLYPLFNQLFLKAGSFITEKNEDEGGFVAVIEENIAWNLFKTKNAVGNTILIYNVPFKIIGVFKKDNSIIERLTDSGVSDVFIPVGKMLELDTTAKIKSLQVPSIDNGSLELNTSIISEALQQIDKNPSDYDLEDYNLKMAAMEQKPKFIIFIMGVLSIFILLVYIKNILTEVIELFRIGCRKDYFTNILKGNLLTVGISVIKILLISGTSLLIWNGIKYKPYIPTRYIPDELINISYYINLIKSNIQSAISNLGFIASNTELVTNTVQTVLNWIFYISIIPGFLMLYIGFIQLKTFNIEMPKVVLYIGLFVTGSLCILAGAAYLLGLPFTIDIKNLIITWSFLSILAVKVSKPKEVK